MDMGILAGMRVVEASAFVAAPLGGMTLAQLGADVIRIDTIGGGLDYHRWPVTQDNVSLFWCGLNKSKRSVALDLSSPEGRELAMALICAPGDDAGMLLTNFPPRGWLDFDRLSARRHDLIQLTIQGDHQGGSAVDYTVNSRVGLPYLTGHESDEEAVNHVLPAWDLITGQLAAVGLLAAERKRRKDGQGQHVQLALEDVALAAVGNLGFIAEAQLGTTRPRQGNYLFGAFARDFLCSDGARIMVVGLTAKQWSSMCDAMGLDEAMDALGKQLNLDLSKEGNRYLARREIAQAVGNWTARHNFVEVASTFEKHGVCWGKYQTVSEMVQSDSVCSEANPLFTTVHQPGVGPLLLPGIPLRFSGAVKPATLPAPLLGADTEEVLVGVVGISTREFGRLHDKGVVATAG